MKSIQKHLCDDFKNVRKVFRNNHTVFIFIKMISVKCILCWFQKCLKCFTETFLLWFQKCLNTSQKLFLAANDYFSLMISDVLEMFSGMISKVSEQDKLFLVKRIFCLLWNVFRMFWLNYFCFWKRNQNVLILFSGKTFFSTKNNSTVETKDYTKVNS